MVPLTRYSTVSGICVEDLIPKARLEEIVKRIPAPTGDPEAPLQALIIDSWFDNYVGVVMLVRVMQGVVKPKDKILLMANGSVYGITSF